MKCSKCGKEFNAYKDEGCCWGFGPNGNYAYCSKCNKEREECPSTRRKSLT